MTHSRWPRPNTTLRYRKGEHRRKHRGTSMSPRMVLQKGNYWIAKCPHTFCEAHAEMLLQHAIPEFRRTLPDTPYRLWAYFDGAIYAACSDDGGATWHGFPHGPPMMPPPRPILRELEYRAESLGETARLNAWLNTTWKTRR
ncbi:hypothetical protein [Pararobbsia silviterrae]|uniref:Uncharacterized protein n=1 Tax=Pararobbsia silviterrae TaxID=1792498 RepID=A0A494XCG0_9BURK|nr:hypothetical protein [Pararobbsia silviterrae]RKP46206.1 hypothetical protein D7S86_25135 [Pararobbsia silviterrae]